MLFLSGKKLFKIEIWTENTEGWIYSPNRKNLSDEN